MDPNQIGTSADPLADWMVVEAVNAPPEFKHSLRERLLSLPTGTGPATPSTGVGIIVKAIAGLLVGAAIIFGIRDSVFRVERDSGAETSAPSPSFAPNTENSAGNPGEPEPSFGSEAERESAPLAPSSDEASSGDRPPDQEPNALVAPAVNSRSAPSSPVIELQLSPQPPTPTPTVAPTNEPARPTDEDDDPPPPTPTVTPSPTGFAPPTAPPTNTAELPPSPRPTVTPPDPTPESSTGAPSIASRTSQG